ncbi:MAG: CPBP family intramembrane glutamic endopeptidase [Parasphingorhabdus sp.]
MITLAAVALALGGPIALIGLVRRFDVDTLSWVVRLSFWAIGAMVLALLAVELGVTDNLRLVGFSYPSFASVFWGVGGAATIIIVTGLSAMIQRTLGLPIGDKEGYERIAALPFARRLFVVVTASFVEEFLYRGVGIGIGSVLVTGSSIAIMISIAAFVAAHFRWQPMHLVQITVAACVLSGLYVLTNGDLWACILAHLIVDGIAFLLMPALFKLKSMRTKVG